MIVGLIPTNVDNRILLRDRMCKSYSWFLIIVIFFLRSIERGCFSFCTPRQSLVRLVALFSLSTRCVPDSETFARRRPRFDFIRIPVSYRVPVKSVRSLRSRERWTESILPSLWMSKLARVLFEWSQKGNGGLAGWHDNKKNLRREPIAIGSILEKFYALHCGP